MFPSSPGENPGRVLRLEDREVGLERPAGVLVDVDGSKDADSLRPESRGRSRQRR